MVRANDDTIEGLLPRLIVGHVSAREVTERSLHRIERENARYTAFVHVAADQALRDADESDRRLRAGTARRLEGIPIAIKDNRMVTGMPTRDGSAMSSAIAATMDSTVVRRLRDAGAVVIGKTALPEFGTVAVTESVLHGVTRNPHDPSRTSGGSSGGSAAAVAAGMVPVAHGNDGGGSLRIPASCCGLFTVKPSRGRVPLGPLYCDTPLGLVTDGFLTNSVTDNALLLDVVSGYDIGDPHWAAPPVQPFGDIVRQVGAGRRLRIGWTAAPPIAALVAPECAAAVEQAAKLCGNLGHVVEQHTPAWSDDQLLPLFMEVWAACIALSVDEYVAAGASAELAEPHNRALWERGQRISGPQFFAVGARLQSLCRRVLQSWTAYDIILTPTLAQLPLLIGAAFEPSDDPMAALVRCAAFTPFTPLINLTGQPAASLPLGVHSGVPVGVQAIGRPGDESTLFELAAELEAAFVVSSGTRSPATPPVI